MKKLVIGLIGGMGSGKSVVADALAQCGARVLSGDQLGHEALRQPEIQARLLQRWGPGVLDEERRIDRRHVATLVFENPDERHALEALVHPWIARRLEEEIAKAQADPAASFIVVDAAIMLEAGWSQHCDKLVFVDAPRETRLKRLALQRGWSEKEVADREKAQLPLTDKAKRADFVVDNSGSPETLVLQVDKLLNQLRVKNAE